MAKKENNRKNYAAREAWERRKRENRGHQVWLIPNTNRHPLKEHVEGAIPIHVKGGK